MKTAPGLDSIVLRANAPQPFVLSLIPDGDGPSDHASFYADSIPVLHFFTNQHPDYHSATDVADKIQAGGEARVVEYAERIARELGSRPARLTYTQSSSPRTMIASSGRNVYLGSIPDMAAASMPGLRLSGVTLGSPADKSGLKSGDIVVELAGKPVTDLNTYTEALYSNKPGDTVDIVVVRDGQKVTMHVTLGKRGQ